jgi:pectate lyase
MKRILLYTFVLLVAANVWAQSATITKSSGWLESAFVEWSPVSGADSYNVYYTGGGQTNKKIDTQLIRSYGAYFRADIPGLASGSYTIKIAPVTATVEGTGSTTSSLTVLPQDRTGFAFDGRRVPGGYKADGTPKTGAVIMYITQNTKNTISMNITGGVNPCVGLQNILYAIKKGNDTRPFIIRLIGNVTDMTVMEGGDITIENANNASSYLTIEGVGDDAVVNGMGIRLKSATNIEVSNLGFMNCDSTAGDNVGMQQDNDHIWVHNCDLFYGNAGIDADQIKGDGAMDNKGSTYVTLSYNHFWDSGKSSLLGLSENTTVGLYITYHHNWFDHSDSRHPRVRFYSAHVYNNYFDGNSKYGAGSTLGSSVFMEGNFFRNCKYPMLTSMQGTDAYNGAVGTFSSEDGGTIKAYNNSMTGQTRYVPYNASAYPIEFDAIETATRDEVISSAITSKQGANTYNNFDTDPALYVKNLAVDIPAVAKDKVMQYAGRVSGGDLKWTFTAADDTSYLVITELKTELTNYTGALVAVQGESATVTGNQTLTSTANNNQTVASGTAIGTIVFTWGGDATDATLTGLPASGISFIKNATAKTITISGTPTATISYSIATSGTLGTAVTGSGTITVTPASVQTLTSTTNNNQTVASGVAIGTIVFTWGRDATDATVTGLPASGISFVKNATAKTITISGTPTATISYSIATSGTLGTAVTGSGTITVTPASAGDETHNFTASGKTSAFYTFGTTANLSTSYGTVTFAGLTLTQCLKIESMTTITYTTKQASTLTLVMNSTIADPTAQIKVDGTIYTNASGIITVSIAAGTHVLSRNNAANLFYIKTVYNAITPVTTAQTITFNTLAPVTYGAVAFNLTATASSSLPISYTSSNTAVATVSGNTLTIVGAGSTNITASQVGNSSFINATDVVQALIVNEKNLTITSPLAQSKTYDGNVAASITGTLSGLINSDDVTVLLSGTFANATPGTGKTVASTSSLTGTKATNYVLIQPIGLTAAITIPAPTANAQAFCGAAIVANLVATGTAIKWYSLANGGSVLNSSTALASGTYYVSQTLAGVEGTARTSVAITIQAAPIAGTNGTLTVCAGTEITNTDLFAVIGTHDEGGTWTNSGSVYTYRVNPTSPCAIAVKATVTVTIQAAPNAGTSGTLKVATGLTPTDSQLFGALIGADAGGSWTKNGLIYTYTVAATSPCTVSDTASVAVSEVIPDAFSVCSGTKISGIVGTPSLKFYIDAKPATLALTGTTPLTVTKTYYVSQMVGGLESSRVSRMVTVLAFPTEVVAAITSSTTGTTAGTYAAAALAVGPYVGTTNQVSYRVPTLGTGLTYYWTVPIGVSIVGQPDGVTVVTQEGVDANILNVNFKKVSSGIGSVGSITVQAQNGSGCKTAAKSVALTKVLPVAPATLVMTDASLPVSATTGLPTAVTSFAKYMGNTTVLKLTAGPLVTATSYVWELPTGVNRMTALEGGSSTLDLTSTEPFIYVNFAGVTKDNTDTNTAVAVLTKVLRIGVKSENGVGFSTTVNSGLLSTAKLLTLTAVAPAAPTALILNDGIKPTAITVISKMIGQGGTYRLATAVPAATIATSFAWELPTCVTRVTNLTDSTPASGTTTDPYIYVKFNGTNPAAGSIYFGVLAVNGVGSSVTVNSGLLSTAKLLKLATVVPAAPTALILNDGITATAITVISKMIGQGGTYRLAAAVPAATLANSFAWELPTCVTRVASLTDSTPASGTTTNPYIYVKFNGTTPAAGSINFGVKAVNGVGLSATAKLLTVTAGLPVVVATVGGSLSVCNRAEGFSYTITAPVGATSYVITAPVGSVVSSANGVSGATPNVLTTSDLTFKVVYNGTAAFTTTDKSLVIRSANFFGPCLTTKALALTKQASCTSLASIVRLAASSVTENFNVIAYPNPSSDVFTLEVQSSGKTKATTGVQVYDMTGRLIEQRQAASNSVEIGNNYPTGVYNVIVKQEENMKTLRVIKR